MYKFLVALSGAISAVTPLINYFIKIKGTNICFLCQYGRIILLNGLFAGLFVVVLVGLVAGRFAAWLVVLVGGWLVGWWLVCWFAKSNKLLASCKKPIKNCDLKNYICLP
jgi:hypothetical protein